MSSEVKKDINQNEFRGLADQWHEQTAVFSSPQMITRHPAYKSIIGMGESAIPLILGDLEARGGMWYPALRVILGHDPVKLDKGDIGNTEKTKSAWLDWGRKEGYLPPVKKP